MASCLESSEKGSRLVATDGRRLVMVELRNCGELDDQALLPHRFCRLVDELTERDTDFLAIRRSSGEDRERRVPPRAHLRRRP